MITVFLADDHPIVRRGLRALLEGCPEFRIVGEAGNGLDTAEMVERLKPDVLLVDVVMPGLSGLEVTRRVHKQSPGTRVIVFSMHNNEAYVAQALKNGAVGYVLKASPAAQILDAVQETGRGVRYLSPPLSEQALAAYMERAGGAAQEGYEMLTARERVVLHLAAEGHTNAEIGARLGISPRTAETHRGRVLRKLGLHTQTDLVRFALRRGILEEN